MRHTVYFAQPWNVKITSDDITYGPKDAEVDEVTAFTIAGGLYSEGYRRISNAYCRVAKIDKENWLDYLALKINCCVADFYEKDGSGVSEHWKDYYRRAYSKDVKTVHPAIYRRIVNY